MSVDRDQQALNAVEEWDTEVDKEHNWWKIGWIAAEMTAEDAEKMTADDATEGAAEGAVESDTEDAADDTKKVAAVVSGGGVAYGYTSYRGRAQILKTTWEFKCKGFTLTEEELKEQTAWAMTTYGWLPEGPQGGYGTTPNVKAHWDKTERDLTWEGKLV